MDDQFDKDIKNRIREVFDNYEDTTADEGWLLLREKFPERNKKRPVIWLWWGAAAGILLFLGIGTWMLSKPDKPAIAVVKPVKKGNSPVLHPGSISKVEPPATHPAAGDNSNLATNTARNKHNDRPATSGTEKHPAAVDNTVLTVTQTPGKNQQSVPYGKSDQTQPAAQQNSITQPGNASIIATQQPGTQPVQKDNAPTQQPDKAIAGKNVIASADVPAVLPAATQAGLPNGKATDKQMEALLAKENTKTVKRGSTDNWDKKVKFSVYAATYINYANGSANQVNAGAGFASDFRLTKRITLSTGVAVAQNSLAFGATSPSATLGTSAAVAGDLKATASYLVAGAQKSSLLASSINRPVYQGYNASLVGLDIPINVKYQFGANNTSPYFSAGLSSGTFINEAYTYRYSYPSQDQGLTAPQAQDQVTRKSFNGFYFAKTLNLAFGLGYTMGNGNRLVIEPFLKYPLDGLGAQQIHFGAGGINLKLNLKTSRK